MSKKYWKMLYNMFTNEEELQEKYSELSNVVNKIMKSIRLSEESDKINEELRELNKED